MVSSLAAGGGTAAGANPQANREAEEMTSMVSSSNKSVTSTSLTKKFTRSSMMRASGKIDTTSSATTTPATTSNNKQDALKMAGARSRSQSRSHSKKNALLRVTPHYAINHRAALAAAAAEDPANTGTGTTKRIILSGNPYRRFELGRTYGGPNAADDQSHADILTTISNLTEPTWAPSMSNNNNVVPSNSMSNLEIVTRSSSHHQHQQQQQQHERHERQDQHDGDKRERRDQHDDDKRERRERRDHHSEDQRCQQELPMTSREVHQQPQQQQRPTSTSTKISSMMNDTDIDRQNNKNNHKQAQAATTLHTRNGVSGDGRERVGPSSQTTVDHDEERRQERRRRRRRSASRDRTTKRQSSNSNNSKNRGRQNDTFTTTNRKSPNDDDNDKRKVGKETRTRRGRSMSVQPTSGSPARRRIDGVHEETHQHSPKQQQDRKRSTSVTSTRLHQHHKQKKRCDREEENRGSDEHKGKTNNHSATETPEICMADRPGRVSMLSTSTIEGFQRPTYNPIPVRQSINDAGGNDDDDDLQGFEEASQHGFDTPSAEQQQQQQQEQQQQQQQPKPKNAIQAARIALRQTQAIRRSHSSSRSVCSHQSNESNALRSISSGVAGGGSVVSTATTTGAAARALALEKGRANISNRSGVYQTSYTSTKNMTRGPGVVTVPSSPPMRPTKIYKARSNVIVSVLGLMLKFVTMIIWGVPSAVMIFMYRIVTLRFLFGRTEKPWTTHRKSVLITNAHTQVGWELAQQLASEGAKLALIVSPSLSSTPTDSIPEKRMEIMAETCRELGSSKCRVYNCADMSNSTSIFLTISQARKDFESSSIVETKRGNQQRLPSSSPFDVVIINGQTYSHGCTFEEIQDASHIDAVVKHNILGSLLMTHHVLPLLRKSQNSRLVVLSSKTGSISATPTQSVFSATQHALRVFIDSLRLEMKEKHSSKQAEVPKVCLVPLPDLASTVTTGSSNFIEQSLLQHQDRVLDMGAVLPATKTYSWATMPLQQAVTDVIIPTIKSGCQYESQSSSSSLTSLSFHLKMYESLRPWFPSFVDQMLDNESKQTYYRPLQEKNNHLTRGTTRMNQGR